VGYNIVAAPEPASVGLIGGGFVAILLMRRRKKLNGQVENQPPRLVAAFLFATDACLNQRYCRMWNHWKHSFVHLLMAVIISIKRMSSYAVPPENASFQRTRTLKALIHGRFLLLLHSSRRLGASVFFTWAAGSLVISQLSMHIAETSIPLLTVYERVKLFTEF